MPAVAEEGGLMDDNVLRDWVAAHPFKGPFRPHIFYHREGDVLNVYWEDARCHADKGGDGFEFYRADDDGRVVGVRLWGVRRRLDTSD